MSIKYQQHLENNYTHKNQGISHSHYEDVVNDHICTNHIITLVLHINAFLVYRVIIVVQQ